MIAGVRKQVTEILILLMHLTLPRHIFKPIIPLTASNTTCSQLQAPHTKLMSRLFTLKITEEEVKALLDHTDSPYIRAVRFWASP